MGIHIFADWIPFVYEGGDLSDQYEKKEKHCRIILGEPMEHNYSNGKTHICIQESRAME